MRRGNTDPPHNLIMDLVRYAPRGVIPYAQYANNVRNAYGQYRRGRDLYNRARYVQGNITQYFNRTRGGTRSTSRSNRRPRGASFPESGMPRRSMPFRGTNRVWNRKRRTKRRKLRYGTKVRKQALGLFEGKRKLEVARYNPAVPARALTRINILENFGAGLTVPTGGSIVQSVFAGKDCFIRGCKMTWFFENLSETQPVDVRIICGWRKTTGLPEDATITVDVGHIFKNTTNKRQPVGLTETAHGPNSAGFDGDGAVWMLGSAPIAKTHFYCAKDMTFRLGPGGNNDKEQVFGSNIKRMQFWWEMNNKKYTVKSSKLSTVTIADLESNSNWWPVVYYYHTTPLARTEVASTIDVTKSWQVYYKDPLG